MYVQLLSVQRVDIQGKPTTLHPGDWVDVGRQTASLWISRGEARLPVPKIGLTFPGRVGVVILRDDEVPFPVQEGREVVRGQEPNLPFDRTLIWDGRVVFRPELIDVGFAFLSTWEVACPLYSYTCLAAHLGSDDDRERTKAVIRDLRIPVYDSRLVFMKKCESSDLLVKAWLKEREESTNDFLAFMRAFYRVKPLMLALPITWTGGSVD